MVSGFDRIIDGVKEVLRMSDELKRVSEGLKVLSVEVRDIDKRLVRIETLAEIAKSQARRPVKRITKQP
ncbi:MAG: hypothetical protein Q7U07_01190 [Gammaproteobacteria bacterium]|nr:hypothetical protein [Gammaproteobacteria bacterium]